MGTTGRFGGGGHGLTGPKHIWYDTDYSELYKGLAVVIGFFLFLVLLLLIFILISYLRKWYRLKKRPDASVAATSAASSMKASALTTVDDAKFAKRYSKSGLPNSSQPATPLVKSAPKQSLSSTPVEIVDGKLVKTTGGVHHGGQQQYHQNQHQHPMHQHQHYQEFPPAHYPPHHHSGNVVPAHSIVNKNDGSQPSNPRSCRPSLATIALT